MTPRIFVSAGEPSGDAHAAAVVCALRETIDALDVEAVGGRHLAAAGARLHGDVDRLGVIGFAEVARAIPRHRALLARIREAFAARRFDAAMLVDYPGFHLHVARAAHRAGIPVLYYIAPQFWAWAPGRVHRFARVVSKFAVVLPFEEPFLQARGVEAEYVGHPVLDIPRPSQQEARRQLGMDDARPVLGVFPGARSAELGRHWPVFRGAAERLQARFEGLATVVAGVSGRDYPEAGSMRVVMDDAATVLAAADVALIKSGTATLEAAIAGVPMVVAYRAHPMTAAIARRVAKVRWISLVNLVAGRTVVPELMQGDVTCDRVAREVGFLLEAGGGSARDQRSGLADVRAALGGAGAARRAAAMLEEMLGARSVSAA